MDKKTNKSKVTIEELKKSIELRRVHYPIATLYKNEFGEVFEYFIDVAIMSGRSINTIDAYYRDLVEFFDYINSQSKSIKKIKSIKTAMINKYLMHLQVKDSLVTVNRKRSSLNTFFLFLTDQGILTENPMPRYEALRSKVKSKNTIMTVLTSEELKQLFEKIESNENDFFRYRDYCMFGYFFNSGLRVSELAKLTLNNLDEIRKNGESVINGKGNKDRISVVSPQAFKTGYIKYIDEYLKLREEIVKIGRYPEDDNILFISIRGGKMTTRGIQKCLKKYMDDSDINKNVTPHTFRHTCATHLAQNGVNATHIQAILGHENLNTTQRYIKLLSQNLKGAITKLDESQK